MRHFSQYISVSTCLDDHWCDLRSKHWFWYISDNWEYIHDTWWWIIKALWGLQSHFQNSVRSFSKDSERLWHRSKESRPSWWSWWWSRCWRQNDHSSLQGIKALCWQKCGVKRTVSQWWAIKLNQPELIHFHPPSIEDDKILDAENLDSICFLNHN